MTAWNPQAERLFGYTERETVGRPIDDLIANREDLRAEAAAFKTDAARTGRFQGYAAHGARTARSSRSR